MDFNKTQFFAEAERNALQSDVSIASYIAFKLAETKLTVTNTTRNGGAFRLTEDLLKLLNTTIVCGNESPLDLTSI